MAREFKNGQKVYVEVETSVEAAEMIVVSYNNDLECYCVRELDGDMTYLAYPNQMEAM